MSRFTTFLSTINFSSTTMFIIFVILTVVWLFNLRIFYRIKNQAAFITVGMLGMFVLMMVFIRPIATMPLARIVAALAGFIGRLTGTFTPYFKYGILFVGTRNGSITLQIDFECSGIIEIMVYLSILAFFRVYTVSERAILSAVGVIYIMVANALRIIIIAVMIHFGGESMYYIAHTYVGRIFFYAATIVLYFYVFTKSQVVRMKVGSFSYDKDKGKDKAAVTANSTEKEKSTENTAEKTTAKASEKKTDKTDSKSEDKKKDNTTEKSAEKKEEKTKDKTTEKTTVKSEEKTKDKTAEKTTVKKEKKPTDKTAEKTTVKKEEKPKSKTAEKTTIKKEEKTKDKTEYKTTTKSEDKTKDKTSEKKT